MNMNETFDNFQNNTMNWACDNPGQQTFIHQAGTDITPVKSQRRALTLWLLVSIACVITPFLLAKLNQSSQSNAPALTVATTAPQIESGTAAIPSICNTAGRLQFETANPDLSRVISLWGNCLEKRLPTNERSFAHLFRGEAFMEIGEHGKAMADYTRATTLLPNDGRLYLYRASAYFKIGEYGKAKEDARTAFALDPTLDISGYMRLAD